jgi:plasmid stabilization system protein ParE
MRLLPVEIHPEAVAEARAAREWYESRSPQAAAAFLAEFDIGIDSIQAAPELYPSHLYRTRRYLMRRFPYLIVYRITPLSYSGHCCGTRTTATRLLENAISPVELPFCPLIRTPV